MSMTLSDAEQISNKVINLVASKPRDKFYGTSQLHGHSVRDIHNAFALEIAKRRRIANFDSTLKEQCRIFAEKTATLLGSMRMVFISDVDAEKLNRLSHDSLEYKKLFAQLISTQLDDNNPAWQEFLQLEALDSFNNFCWTLEASDPHYWYKIYTHLDLLYDESDEI